jgi:hypothetical protein
MSLVLALSLAEQVLAQDIKLDEPQAKVGLDLLDTIKARVAMMTFVKRDIPLSDLSTILWAGNGMKGVDVVSGASTAGRTIPYAGGNDYVNVYVFTSAGVYQYVPEEKLLRQRSKGDARALVTPQNIETASLMILFTFDADKMELLLKFFLPKFPTIYRDVGNATASFAAENIMLAAAAFGLGSVVMTNIMPAASFAQVVKLGSEESPLFIVQLGYLEQ